MGRARIGAAPAAAAVAFAFACAPPWARAAGPLSAVLWADRDDDDRDGRPDGEENPLPLTARADVIPLDPAMVGAALRPLRGGEHVRVLSSAGTLVPWGRTAPAHALLQGITPGRADLVGIRGTAEARFTVDVWGLELRDGRGKVVDLTSSNASIERTPPSRAPATHDEPYDNPDSLRVLVARPDSAAAGPSDEELAVQSLTDMGQKLDALMHLHLTPVSCDELEPGMRCLESAPLRVVMDDEDRNHPLAVDRSIKGQVGGAVVFRSQGRKAQAVRVLGPRNSPIGPIGRLRATLRPFVVRVAPGGAPAIGGTEVGAVLSLRSELAAASAIWGQCGVSFGEARSVDVKVVDPPPPHLLALGDDLGLPASGGVIHIQVDGKPVSVRAKLGESPERVSNEVAQAVERAGFEAIVSANARIAPGFGPSVDVSIRRRDRTLSSIQLDPNHPLSTDATLSVRIGSVELADGLQHFTDMDSMAGTLEERTLIKAVDDGDPTTIEVLVVPLFAGGGRIGESFIGSDWSSVRNVVLLDRAGIRARKSSLTLAHELGHVLMDLPGHPDDYGPDTPTQLMDSDAADASPFGPRRLSVEECARAVRQTGPRSRAPLLFDWPATPLSFEPNRGR